MPKKTDAGNPGDWLLFVATDLDAVELMLGHETAFPVARIKLTEALEKAIKADLLRLGWKLEKIHDLQKLCDYLAKLDSQRAETLQPVVDELAECYTFDRYPGFEIDDPDWSLLRELKKHVDQYVSHLQRVIRKKI